MGDYVGGALSVMRGGPQVEVELPSDRKTSAWAKDRTWQPIQKATLDIKGCLTLVLQIADTPVLVGWILSFGPGVKVIGPASLMQEIRSQALQIAAQE